MMYTQDYDEHYPRNWECEREATTTACPQGLDNDKSKPSGTFKISGNSTGTGFYRTWMDFIFPYVKSTQLFVCPSSTASSDMPNYGYSAVFGNYNGAAARFGSSSLAAYVPISMATVVRPAEVICVSEFSRRYSYAMSPGTDYRNQTADSASDMVTPHLDGGTAMYADGHAKWRSRATILGNIGSDFSHDCNLNLPLDSIGYCSRAWNPFLN